MRKVVITDAQGYLRAFLIREADPDSVAEQGIPLSPPDLGVLDWEAVKRELHNGLVERCIFSWQDIEREQDAISNLVRFVLKRRIIALFRQEGS